MKSYKTFCLLTALVFLVTAAGLNFWYLARDRGPQGTYRVEAARLAGDIESSGTWDLSDYPHLTGVYTAEDGPLYSSDRPYVIIEARGQLYRVEYSAEADNTELMALELVLCASGLLLALVLIYVGRHIIAPFDKLTDVPRELARGDLAVPLPQQKSRYFGKFTWGVELLRESIEASRQRELGLQREKKLMLLSLSHDVKTPLSAIKLSAKAISKGLYKDEEKNRQAAESIDSRADEIDRYITEITRTASEDLMSFDINLGEEYLTGIISRVEARYRPQLELTGTELRVDKFPEALLACDPDRLAECLQNLIENAIKYGDGRLIALSFEKQEGCQLITVRNTGCTLPPRELTEIMSSFQRGSNSQGIRGNGLGLYICKQLMTLMNGEVFLKIEEGEFRATLVVRLA